MPMKITFTQRWASVNQKVMPFCVANSLLTIILIYLLDRHGIDLTISEFGHNFVSILVSFLVINKLSYSPPLYYELQGRCSKMKQSAVEITQLACAYTSEYHQEEYKEWRCNVMFQVLTISKSATFVIYKQGEESVWEIPGLRDDPPVLDLGQDLHKKNVANFGSRTTRTTSTPKSDKNLRVPIRVAQQLREAILKHRSLSQNPMTAPDTQSLLNLVKQFMDSYHGIRKYLTCPFSLLPLPLVQLGRIFVIFYCFTLPFASLNSKLNLKYLQMILLIWLMTYGFMGIELFLCRN